MRNSLLRALLLDLLITGGCLTIAFNAGAETLRQSNTPAKIIGIRLSNDNLAQFGMTLPQAQLIERVAKNLAEWRYPVQADLHGDFADGLEASIGMIRHAQTPVGFSFSAGNSDPRAMEFQKADVLPVNCRFIHANARSETPEIQLTFSAKQLLEARQSPQATGKIADQLVDHISTTCFKLLEDLEDIRPVQPAVSASKIPAWMPTIRIESQEQPKTAPPGTKQAAEQSGTPDAADEQPEAEPETSKQITIHNLGSPVILKFGHERR